MKDKLILGTVQLGLNYGVNNNLGKPSLETAFNILNLAYDRGVRTLDTAEAYGDSQEVIGAFIKENPEKKFNIITKLSAAHTLKKGDLVDHIYSNCKILNIESLEGYMFHNYDSFKKADFFYKEILNAKKKGIILNAGISLYDNQEVEDIIANYYDFDFIQIPFNLFDNDLKRKSIIKKAKSKGIKIHVRSVFLQGLFFKNLEALPEKIKLLKPYLEVLNKIKKENKINIEVLALQYVLQKKYIDKVLVGIDNAAQLDNNIDISSEQIDIPYKTIDAINVLENKLLNPSNWN